MSGDLQSRWSPDFSFEDHMKLMDEGLTAITDTLIVPDDMRYEIVYALQLSARGQKGSVLALGDGGTGKTTLGDLMYGGQYRSEIDREAIAETLYGAESPVDHKMTQPTIKGLVPENPIAYLNEVSHMPNTGALHRLWDLPEIEVGGKIVPLRDISIYMTSNFPNGHRVYALDEAFRSRVTVEMLSGDHAEDKKVQLQDGNNSAVEKDYSRAPILPIAATRRAIYEAAAARYPVGKNGQYIVSLVNALNTTGLVDPYINASDARLGESLHDVARARMLVERAEHSTTIDARKIANVVALVLPTVVKLNPDAIERMLVATNERRPSNIEKAVAVRRFIARIAFETFYQDEVMTSTERGELIRKATDKYSYANAEALQGIDVDKLDEALFSDKSQGAEEDKAGRKKRGLRQRISRKSS